jgi:hypothetical protein
LLYPADLSAVAHALEHALGAELEPDRAGQALRRVDAAVQRAGTRGDGPWGARADRDWADDLAARSLVVSRGAPRIAPRIELFTIDDDTGGPFAPPARAVFPQTLRQLGIDVRAVERPGGVVDLVIALYADIRAWKGTPGLSPAAARAAADAVASNPDATVVFFGHPRLTEEVPGRHVVAAWGGEAIMQRAAASWLARTR